MITLKENGLAEALIAPDLGGWLLRYARSTPAHGMVEVLHFDQAVVDRYPNQMYAGNPLLFPFASYNVLNGKEHLYEWSGKEYSLPQHGFARKLPWQVTSQSETSATMTLESAETTRANYPFEFALKVTYSLSGGRLHFRQQVENRSPWPMPFSSGIHPYFKAPVLPGGRRSDCRILLPSAHRHEMQGKAAGFVEHPQPPLTLRADADVSGTLFLGSFSKREIVLEDPFAHLKTTLNFDNAPDHRFAALWAPSAEAPFYCIEPWTALPNAFGRRDGLTLLAPGATTEARMWMDLSPI